MIFKNANGVCPCCGKRRSAHTPKQQATCSAWNKAHLTPARTRRDKVTRQRADGLTTLIHNQENY